MSPGNAFVLCIICLFFLAIYYRKGRMDEFNAWKEILGDMGIEIERSGCQLLDPAGWSVAVRTDKVYENLEEDNGNGRT